MNTYLKDFVESLKIEKNSAPLTLKSYEKDIRRFLEFLGNDISALKKVSHLTHA